MLETVLVLPILLLLIFVMVQFGLFFENMQQLTLASRVGAEEASQIALPGSGGVPQSVLDAINAQLQSSRMSYCCVTLEHNVGGTPVKLVTADCPAGGVGATNPVPSRTYVRVSISVPKRAAMPACLRAFTCASSCDVVGATTVFRYELTP